MNNPKVCPDCGMRNTERVYHDFETYRVIAVRMCNSCHTEYDVTYADPIIEVVDVGT